ncbi:hypothetical protein KVT40_007526 [Elsinoe batatas]|uniref:Oxidoreductase acuF-like C2H2 type zinc-finger domain-containing protein n=1 Tax=Elsinoe batatas TaxID=2601811 RepID=A0A8K0KX88_9PEZI|nr:hypothetical protein KVT40_007526 [Elsinoe batatas]
MRKDAGSATDAALGTTSAIIEDDEFLISRLIETMDYRRRLLVYRRRHARKLAGLPLRKTGDEWTVGPWPTQRGKDVVQSTGTHSLAIERTPIAPVEIPDGSHLSGTKATTAVGNLDDLVDTESVVSYSSSTFMMSSEEDDLPPPPPAVRHSSEFLCPYCNVVCPKRDGIGKAWKLHVVRDLQPYICTYTDCNHETQCFASSKQWLEHERTQHRRIWKCYQHAESLYMSADALKRHLEISHKLTHIQIEQLLTGASSTAVDTRSTCLFCNAIGPFTEGLEKHMAAHMIRFARFSIPRAIVVSEETDIGTEEQLSVAAQGLRSETSAMIEIRKPQMHEIKIAWICATTSGYVIARAMLDKAFDAQFREELVSTGGDVTFGRINEQGIVIAQCPAGKSTGAVARDLVILLPKVEIAISAGIGGALPTPAVDLRLGDVAIACSSLSSTGLVERDLGKDVKESVTGGRDYKRLPPRMLAALESMRSKTEAHQAVFDRILQQFLDSADETLIASMERPDPETDNLIKPSFHHPKHAPSCETCVSAAEVLRPAREEPLPKAHYGLIASGNYSSTSSEFRDGIQKATDIFRYLPCVVVRGICDYADSHWNKAWRPYAGLAAAAYVKELILSIDGSDAVSQEGVASFVSPHLSPMVDDTMPSGQAPLMSAASSALDTRMASTSDEDVTQDLFVGRGTIRNTVDPPRLLQACRHPDTSQLCGYLTKFNDQSLGYNGYLKILVTSHSFPTHFSQMQASLRPISTISDKDDAGTVGIEADLIAVTKDEVVKLGSGMGLSDNAMLRIGQQLMCRSDGTFLWHNLALDWLRRNLVSEMVDEEVLGVLSKLPKSIPSFYTETLAIIPTPKLHIFRAIFMMASGAYQPLTAFELFGALRLFPNDHVRDEVGLLGANFGLMDMIKNDSGGLLVVSESGIRLSSPMVKDCLLTDTNHTSIKFDPQDVTDMMAFLCLRCLLVFQPEGPAKFNYFVSYAVPYVAHHIAEIPAITQLDVSALTALVGDRSGEGGLQKRTGGF